MSLNNEQMNVKIEESWRQCLAAEWDSDYFATLVEFVRGEYAAHRAYPPAGKIFAAFNSCAFDSVKVVILGQDPYHGPGQANGLSFSVNPGVAVPRSLSNIYSEIRSDIGDCVAARGGGDLSCWAKQGVLLLNATLTVAPGCPGSHQGHGWEELTDAAVRALSDKREGLVFMLWGAYAARKGSVIDRRRHLVLTAAHPSPLSASRGFFGCRHFSKANDYLKSRGEEPILW